MVEVWKRIILDGSTVGQRGRQDQHLSVSRRRGCRMSEIGMTKIILVHVTEYPERIFN